MTPIAKELNRLSYTLMLRGVLMLLLGASAVAWTEPTLIAAMFGVGLIAALTGVFEAAVALSMRRRTPRWWLVLADGGASAAFGLLTVGASGLSLRVALLVIAAWFLVYAAIALICARILWSTPAIRWALVVWGMVDVGLAILAISYPAATIFALLFFGAVYAAIFGAWQLGVGMWLRRTLRGARSGDNEKSLIVPLHN